MCWEDESERDGALKAAAVHVLVGLRTDDAATHAWRHNAMRLRRRAMVARGTSNNKRCYWYVVSVRGGGGGVVLVGATVL